MKLLKIKIYTETETTFEEKKGIIYIFIFYK